MAKERIVVVEDEEDIQELIRYNLEREGYTVRGVTTGEAALTTIKDHPPDLVLLDIMLPGKDGLDICKTLKSEPKTRAIPVIMLTAKGEEADIVTGLELGADDYVTKPFSPRVLIARIRTVLRRQTTPAPDEGDVLRVHDVSIHPGRHEVRIGEQSVDLTFTEFRILSLLARRPGWVFTRTQIVDRVHGDDYPVTERSVDVQIVSLRKKLGSAGKYIETVRGVGYRFSE